MRCKRVLWENKTQEPHLGWGEVGGARIMVGRESQTSIFLLKTKIQDPALNFYCLCSQTHSCLFCLVGWFSYCTGGLIELWVESSTPPRPVKLVWVFTSCEIHTLWKILFKYTIFKQKLKLEPGWGSSTWPITYSTLSKGRTSHLCGDEKCCLTWYKSWKTDHCIALFPPSWHNHGKSWQENAFKTQLQKLTVTFERTHFCLKEKKKEHVSSVTCILVVINIHFNTLYDLNHCHWMFRALNTLDSTSWVDHRVGPWVIKMHQRLYSCCSSIDYSLRL